MPTRAKVFGGRPSQRPRVLVRILAGIYGSRQSLTEAPRGHSPAPCGIKMLRFHQFWYCRALASCPSLSPNPKREAALRYRIAVAVYIAAATCSSTRKQSYEDA